MRTETAQSASKYENRTVRKRELTTMEEIKEVMTAVAMSVILAKLPDSELTLRKNDETERGLPQWSVLVPTCRIGNHATHTFAIPNIAPA